MFLHRFAMLSLFGFLVAGLTMSQPELAAQVKKDDKKDTKKDDKKDTKKDDKKDTGKDELRDDWPKVKGSIAKVVKVDAEKGTANVKYGDGKSGDLIVKDAEFLGPRGGKTDIKDERFAAGRTIKIVLDDTGKKVKQIHLQVMTAEDKEKEKPKDKK